MMRKHFHVGSFPGAQEFRNCSATCPPRVSLLHITTILERAQCSTERAGVDNGVKQR